MREYDEAVRRLEEMHMKLEFSRQVDAVLSGRYPRHDAVKICDTPQILLDLGCEALPVLYTQKHLKDALLPINRAKHTHGIDLDVLKGIGRALAHPVAVYDSFTRADSMVVLTSSLDQARNPIIVSIRPNGMGWYESAKVRSNFVMSIYGKKDIEKRLEDAAVQGKVLFYDKNKSQALFSVLRVQFPEALNNLDSDHIIRKSSSVVNGILEKSQEMRVNPWEGSEDLRALPQEGEEELLSEEKNVPKL